MRTTIDLPDDLHAQALAISRDTSLTLSQTVADLIRRGMSGTGTGKVTKSRRTGLSVVHLGRMITTEDVRQLDDEA
ncbi:MAG: antitoxin [Acidimicrobiales bacterium]